MKNDHKEVIITVILTTWCQAHIFTMLLFDRLLLAVALAVVTLPSCLGQPLPQLTSIVEEPGPEVLPYDPVIAQTGMMVAEECPLMPGCCEEDCCGPDTTWSSPFCFPSPGSPGFDGTYSEEYLLGCHPRVCCGADCCGEGTLYDEATASCTPVDIQTAGPGPGVDGAVGDDCYTDEECSTESCVFDPPTPDGLGRCSCNPEYKENDGCEGEFQCMTPGEIGAAVGTLISVAPHCKLPVGAKCKTGGECLTTNCDDVTGLCACNTFTHFPCDPKSGGICAFDEVDGYYCDKVVIGDGSLGAICLEAGDCDSNYCNYGMWSMGSGTCTCNPQTNAGCEGDYKCFPDLNALGIADADPLCRLPYNAPCVPGEDNCITFNCDPQTNRCGCDTAVQYPCDRKNDEVCIYSEENGHVCQALTAVSIPVPVDIPAVGDGSKGSTCYSNGDCDSDNCFHGMMWEPGGAGRCQCNPSTNSGCDDGFKCLANLEETQGIADAGPGCYLPYNATCKPGDRCSTGACDEISGRCPCNTFTQYPCDGDEMCVADVNQGHICKVPTVLVPVIDSEGIAIAGGMEAPGQLIEIPDIGMAIPAPDLNEVEVGDGSIGSSCGTNEDCDSGYCNYGFGGRSCTCNPETNAGCDGEYQCSANLIETQRLADAPPACYLPMDATCDPRKYDCLSGVCDKLTNKCACNTFSQWPCEENGQICVRDEEEGHICEEMERTLGSDCLSDEHCDSGSCYRDPQIPWDFPGFCVCTKDSGCDDGQICAYGSDLFSAQMLMDAPPRCVIGVGEKCNPEERKCITGVCDEQTKLCACNPGTNYGCDLKKQERCVIDDVTNQYVCVAKGADSTPDIGAKGGSDAAESVMPAPPNCPISMAMCAMIYQPVVCNGCEYGNQCEATGASSLFTKETCQPGK